MYILYSNLSPTMTYKFEVTHITPQKFISVTLLLS
uniref:Uncharacterized protein n=1 Tax=Lepeophtheirus salmonis TaxID=72036 RepID=A0A0K2UL57_LEPSM